MHASPQHDRQSPPLPEPEVTESDFGAFFDEAEAFCDAEEARATHPDTVAFFARLAEANINVDMIVQNISEDGKSTDMTFTVPNGDVAKALAEKSINIRAITTSEIKISILIDGPYAELAVRTLHSVYGLDKK